MAVLKKIPFWIDPVSAIWGTLPRTIGVSNSNTALLEGICELFRLVHRCCNNSYTSPLPIGALFAPRSSICSEGYSDMHQRVSALFAMRVPAF